MKQLVQIVAVGLALANGVYAADEPLSRAAVETVIEKYRPEAIRDAEKDLSDALSDLKRAPKGAGAAQYRRNLSIKVADTKKRIAGLKSKEIRPVPKFEFFDAQVGYFGRCEMLDNGEEWLRVVEVLGAKEVLVVPAYSRAVISNGGGLRPRQTEGKREFIICGMDTSKLVDDDKIRLRGNYRVAGKGKTNYSDVLIVEKFDLDKLLSDDSE
ncbi:MAG: hypothetical protein NT069_03320 [Planctomycetota bacterium]|nr:hypothetical protein [Planctomycetota bacterium]